MKLYLLPMYILMVLGFVVEIIILPYTMILYVFLFMPIDIHNRNIDELKAVLNFSFCLTEFMKDDIKKRKELP
jgi:hypothetical protein